MTNPIQCFGQYRPKPQYKRGHPTRRAFHNCHHLHILPAQVFVVESFCDSIVRASGGVCAIIPFTRQLAIEYASLFDILLPALDRLDLPFPLGGTSNHFRIEALVEVGAWDAFNVTEDADLGLRLARAGYRCRTLRSRTFEEAPITFGPWLRQRTRWLKGWIQTYCVHMRRPLQLLSRLGPVRFLAVQAVFGGVVAASFAHPVFVAIVASQVARGDIFVEAGNPLISMLIWLGAFNLLAGYLAGVAIAVAALRHRSMWWLIPELALLPVYWLTMSIAAVRALWQLAHAPSVWEKTEHGLTRMDKARVV